MLTGEQIRAARGLLGWGQAELAAKSEIGLTTIRRLEARDGSCRGPLAQPCGSSAPLRRAASFSREDQELGAGVRLAKPRQFVERPGKSGPKVLGRPADCRERRSTRSLTSSGTQFPASTFTHSLTVTASNSGDSRRAPPTAPASRLGSSCREAGAEQLQERSAGAIMFPDLMPQQDGLPPVAMKPVRGYKSKL